MTVADSADPAQPAQPAAPAAQADLRPSGPFRLGDREQLTGPKGRLHTARCATAVSCTRITASSATRASSASPTARS